MGTVHRLATRLMVGLVAVVVVALAAAVPAAAAAPEWNIARIGAPGSGAGSVIAVVDTGVDASHPVFGSRVLPAIDLVGGAGGDPQGHGTHVAGTAAGADAGCGNIGVAPDASILPVRVLDAEGSGTVDDVAEGIRRAADAGATVINLSLGSDVLIRNLSGSGLDGAIRYAFAKGSIPVLAAGNDGLLGGVFGSGYGDLPAVVVTATDNQDRVASYATSIGSAMWGIAAPGGDASGQQGRDVLSSFPGRRCALLAGTSMAAPHVSGALAVLRAQGYSPQGAIERLLVTARDVGPSSTYGAGRVDLAAAGSSPTTVAPTTAPSTTPPATARPSTAPATPTTRPAPSTSAPSTTRAPSTTVSIPSTPSTAPPTSATPITTAPPSAGSGGPLPGSTPSTLGPLPLLPEGASEQAVRLELVDDGEAVPLALTLVAAGAAASVAGAGVVLVRRRPGG